MRFISVTAVLWFLCSCQDSELGVSADGDSELTDAVDAIDLFDREPADGADTVFDRQTGDLGSDQGVDRTAADQTIDDGDLVDDSPQDDGGDIATVLTLWTLNLLNPSNPLSPSADVEIRTQIVIDAMLDEQPDLVAFQEVVDSGTVPNRAEFIANATGYEWAWQKEYSLVIYDEGIAVLSRTPILETESIELPHKDLVLFTRYVLGARVESSAGPIDFYCTHMTVGGSEQESADQAAAAWAFITERSRSAGLPAFFAGDLNAEPDKLSMRFLRGEASHDGATGDFVDVWLETRPGDPGYTIDSSDPHDRIDYIYTASTASFSVQPVDCQLIFEEAVDGVLASDHIGVSCQVVLNHGQNDN